MPDKFQNKHRIASARLKNWDYGWNAPYFVTICTKNREHYFGEIENGKMVLSEIGKNVEIEWMKTVELRPDMNLKLDAFVVMPNHFHAIIIIGKNEYNSQNGDGVVDCRDAMHRVSTSTAKNQFAPQQKNLASIIRGFKSAVTKHARISGYYFQWQSRFHDHIIRNNTSFKRIKHYIETNIQNWTNDGLNKIRTL